MKKLILCLFLLPSLSNAMMNGFECKLRSYEFVGDGYSSTEIGAYSAGTTNRSEHTEYRRVIEGDGSLARRVSYDHFKSKVFEHPNDKGSLYLRNTLQNSKYTEFFSKLNEDNFFFYKVVPWRTNTTEGYVALPKNGNPQLGAGVFTRGVRYGTIRIDIFKDCQSQ